MSGNIGKASRRHTKFSVTSLNGWLETEEDGRNECVIHLSSARIADEEQEGQEEEEEEEEEDDDDDEDEQDEERQTDLPG